MNRKIPRYHLKDLMKYWSVSLGCATMKLVAHWQTKPTSDQQVKRVMVSKASAIMFDSIFTLWEAAYSQTLNGILWSQYTRMGLPIKDNRKISLTYILSKINYSWQVSPQERNINKYSQLQNDLAIPKLFCESS